METIADRYQRLAARFAATIDEAPSGSWSNQSPCPDWTAIDVVRHVVESENMFFGMVGKPPVGVSSDDEDPAEAWRTVSAAVLADLRDPQAATTGFDGFFGPTTYEEAVDRFLCIDLIVHRWDLATALGVDASIPEADIEFVEAGVAQLGDSMRTQGAFGDAIEPPAGADGQTRLLAFLGRSA
jgi:uncharacterized protein (TIGR03086 family)